MTWQLSLHSCIASIHSSNSLKTFCNRWVIMYTLYFWSVWKLTLNTSIVLHNVVINLPIVKTTLRESRKNERIKIITWVGCVGSGKNGLLLKELSNELGSFSTFLWSFYSMCRFCSAVKWFIYALSLQIYARQPSIDKSQPCIRFGYPWKDLSLNLTVHVCSYCRFCTMNVEIVGFKQFVLWNWGVFDLCRWYGSNSDQKLVLIFASGWGWGCSPWCGC